MLSIFARLALVASVFVAGVANAQDKPNILVIWGDDVGQSNISAYTMGLVRLPHAEHRPHRQRGHDLHRLLR